MDDGQTDIRTDADRQAEGPMTSGEMEQLKQIVENAPVWAGDLISKHDRTVLVERGYVAYRKGSPEAVAAVTITSYEMGRALDGERLGGFVPTEEGIAAYLEENLHVNLNGARG